jgi:hypothetical protein
MGIQYTPCEGCGKKLYFGRVVSHIIKCPDYQRVSVDFEWSCECGLRFATQKKQSAHKGRCDQAILLEPRRSCVCGEIIENRLIPKHKKVCPGPREVTLPEITEPIPENGCACGNLYKNQSTAVSHRCLCPYWRKYQETLPVKCEGISGGIRDWKPPTPKEKKPNLTVGGILDAVMRFIVAEGHPPSHAAGDASLYFDRPETWKGIECALRSGNRGLVKGSSLSKLLKELGVRGAKPDHTLDSIKEAMIEYRDAHGVYPTQASGDASLYVGFPETWKAIAVALYIGGRGLPKGHTLLSLEDTIRKESETL